MTKSQVAAAAFSFFLSESLASTSKHTPQLKGSLVLKWSCLCEGGMGEGPGRYVCVCAHLVPTEPGRGMGARSALGSPHWSVGHTRYKLQLQKLETHSMGIQLSQQTEPGVCGSG